MKQNETRDLYMAALNGRANLAGVPAGQLTEAAARFGKLACDLMRRQRIFSQPITAGYLAKMAARFAMAALPYRY